MNKQHIANWVFRLEVTVISVTAITLILLALSTQGMNTFEKVHGSLRYISISGITILFVIVGYYLFSLFNRYIKKIPGSGLSLNLLLRTLFLSSIPILFISYFSVQFIGHRFQASFDQRIDDALTNALTLSEKALEKQRTLAIKNTEEVPRIILASNVSNKEFMSRFDGIRQYLNFDELTIFDQNGFIKSHSARNLNRIMPTKFLAKEIAQADFESFNMVESIENGFQIRTIVRFREELDLNDKSDRFYVQSVILIPDSLANLTKQVEETVNARDKFNYLRPQVSSGFISVLILMTLLSLLFLILSSIALSDYMVKPIRELIRATVKVRQGNFDLAQKNVTRSDDFGTLLKSFSLMTDSLRDANARAEISQRQVERQRAYLATVIDHISSPVITLNQHRVLLMFNERAEKLLATPLTPFVEQIDTPSDGYATLLDALSPYLDEVVQNRKTLTKEITINIGHVPVELLVNMTELPRTSNHAGGFVILFEPIAEFHQRQKAEAWSEVARRLAHEIKNPLTPIQLAAERLKYKLSGSLDENHQKVLDKSTTIIVNQVKAMQNMVDDFSQFAKPIEAEQRINLTIEPLLQEVIALYEHEQMNYSLQVTFPTNPTVINGDAVKLRQVFHNVIKNGIEAIQHAKEPSIHIRTERYHETLNIYFTDNGVGLPNDKGIFEPYVTTKEKGTGLGLAIVKKIMNEHDGNITIQNNLNAGVTVKLTLPIAPNKKTDKIIT